MTDAVEKAQALLARERGHYSPEVELRRALSAMLAEHAELQQAVALKDAAFEALSAQHDMAVEQLTEGRADARVRMRELDDRIQEHYDASKLHARAARIWKRLAKRLFAFRSLYRRTSGRPERLSAARGKPAEAPLPCFASGCGCWKERG